MKFPSKKGPILSLIIWGSNAFISYTLLTIWNDDQMNTVGTVLTSLLLLVFILFSSWLWCSTYYVVKDQQLLIRSGPMRLLIPVESIHHVQKTSSPLSSPALSIDRLEIGYDLNAVMISPHDKEAFLKALNENGASLDIEAILSGKRENL